MIHHRCAIILAEFLTPDIVIPNLQYLFKYGKINSDRFNRDICLKLMDAVNESQVRFTFNGRIRDESPEEFYMDLKKRRDSRESRRRNSGSLRKPKKGIMRNSKKNRNAKVQSVVINTSDYGHILDMTDFKETEKKKFKSRLLYPGLDNTTKYKVCFYCLRKEGKELMLCPRCQLIYFCSDECNRASLKLETIHVCNLNFYSSELAKMKSTVMTLGESQNHSELYAQLEENCEGRLKRKIEEENELVRLQFAEERKSDTYGTKWVRWKREQTMRVKRTPTNQTLVGSVGNLARLESDIVSVERKDTHDSIARRTISGSDRHAPLLKNFLASPQKKERCKVLRKERQHSPKKVKCGHKECTAQEKDGNCCKKDYKEVVRRFKMKEGVATNAETKVIVQKLRSIPTKYETFVGLLTKYFPDVNFSSLFLPYTCYSNGHLYYKFSDNESVKRTYSMI